MVIASRKLVMGLLAMAAFGCSMPPAIQFVPQKVEVPVAEKPPTVAIPPVPQLQIQELGPDSSDAEMMAAWVASVQQLKADDQRLRALLEPYGRESQAAGTP